VTALTSAQLGQNQARTAPTSSRRCQPAGLNGIAARVAAFRCAGVDVRLTAYNKSSRWPSYIRRHPPVHSPESSSTTASSARCCRGNRDASSRSSVMSPGHIRSLPAGSFQAPEAGRDPGEQLQEFARILLADGSSAALAVALTHVPWQNEARGDPTAPARRTPGGEFSYWGGGHGAGESGPAGAARYASRGGNFARVPGFLRCRRGAVDGAAGSPTVDRVFVRRLAWSPKCSMMQPY